MNHYYTIFLAHLVLAVAVTVHGESVKEDHLRFDFQDPSGATSVTSNAAIDVPLDEPGEEHEASRRFRLGGLFSKDSAAEALEKANRLRDEDKPDKAYEHYRQVMQKWPGTPAAEEARMESEKLEPKVRKAKGIYVETRERQGFALFRPRTKKPTPEEQLAYAHRLRAEGRNGKAMKNYKSLYKRWPHAPEAASAQYQYAKILMHEDKLAKASDAFEQLLKEHPGRAHYDQTLEHLFEMAKELSVRRKGGIFSAPERAIPVLQIVVKYGPQWSHAAEAQYRMGKIHQDLKEYEEAIEAYNKTKISYGDTSWAEEASFQKSYCQYMLSEESPNNKELSEQAWVSMTLFLKDYPDSRHAETVRNFSTALMRRRARAAYEEAKFYDKMKIRPKAALRAYETFVRRFPSSEWTTYAQWRIQELKKIVSEPGEQDDKSLPDNKPEESDT